MLGLHFVFGVRNDAGYGGEFPGLKPRLRERGRGWGVPGLKPRLRGWWGTGNAAINFRGVGG